MIYRGDVTGIVSTYIHRQHAAGVRLPPEGPDRIWEALQEKYPHFIQREPEKGVPPLSVASVISFIQYLVKRGINKRTVPVAEAERRAEICMSCPKREAFYGCSLCVAAVKKMVNPPKLIDFGNKAACRACGCYLPAKVFVPRELLDANHDWWEECWMREDGPPS